MAVQRNTGHNMGTSVPVEFYPTVMNGGGGAGIECFVVLDILLSGIRAVENVRSFFDGKVGLKPVL